MTLLTIVSLYALLQSASNWDLRVLGAKCSVHKLLLCPKSIKEDEIIKCLHGRSKHNHS